jgi:hypothetical protein
MFFFHPRDIDKDKASHPPNFSLFYPPRIEYNTQGKKEKFKDHLHTYISHRATKKRGKNASQPLSPNHPILPPISPPPKTSY